jgi:hypothetical protein
LQRHDAKEQVLVGGDVHGNGGRVGAERDSDKLKT